MAETDQQCTSPDLHYSFIFYLNGDVSKKESDTIEEHVRDCIKCQKHMITIMLVSEALASSPEWEKALKMTAAITKAKSPTKK